MKNKLLLVAAVVAATIAIAASLLVGLHFGPNMAVDLGAHVFPVFALAAVVLRWVAIGLIAAYATSRRSLTARFRHWMRQEPHWHDRDPFQFRFSSSTEQVVRRRRAGVRRLWCGIHRMQLRRLRRAG